MLIPNTSSPSFSSLTYEHLRKQLHLRERHRYGRKLSHRHLHTATPHVPRRPARAPVRVLDEEMDRHDAVDEEKGTDRSVRLLHVLGTDVLARLCGGDQPVSLEVGAVCAEWGGECVADGGGEEGECGQEWVGDEEESTGVTYPSRGMI